MATTAIYTAPASELVGEPGHKSYLSGIFSAYAERMMFVAQDATVMMDVPYAGVSSVSFSKWGYVTVETPDGKSRQFVMSGRARSPQNSSLIIGGTALFAVFLNGAQKALPPQIRESGYFGPLLIVVGLVGFAAMYVKYGLPLAKNVKQLRSVIGPYVKVT